MASNRPTIRLTTYISLSHKAVHQIQFYLQHRLRTKGTVLKWALPYNFPFAHLTLLPDKRWNKPNLSPSPFLVL